MKWIALRAVLLLTCATVVWSQQNPSPPPSWAPPPPDKPGKGTITGVIAGTDLTGGGTSGTVTLNLDTTKVPQLGAANTFTANQTVNGNVTAEVANATTSVDLAGTPFAFGSYATQNAYLGFAGNSAMTGSGNTASGWGALFSNTTGGDNTAKAAFSVC